VDRIITCFARQQKEGEAAEQVSKNDDEGRRFLLLPTETAQVEDGQSVTKYAWGS
jgi:hypothetical protein